MSLIGKIKSILPASSRSLHALHADVGQLIEDNRRLADVVRQNQRNCVTLAERLDAYEAQSMALLWDAYRERGETLEEAKFRFFGNLPKAEGALREHQLKLADLLTDFDAFCKKNHIEYFLATGTLLGAIRHGGFVPWDDDVDVGMMHDDVDRLIEAVLADDRFEVTTLYDQYVFCRQVRFIRAGADANSDPFIDVFIYEYSGCESSDDLQVVKDLRAELMSEFDALHQRYPERYALNAYVSEGEESTSIQDVYNRYREKAVEKGLYSDKKDAVSIIWSIENVSYGDPTHIIPIANYRGMEETQFEGSTYPILKNSDILLGQHYGDWLSIPPDFKSHKHYVSLT